MSDTTERQEKFLTKMLDFMMMYVPYTSAITAGAVGVGATADQLKDYYKDQLTGLIYYKGSISLVWNITWNVGATMVVKPTGDILYSWSYSSRNLSQTIASMQLYQALIDFGCPFELLLKDELSKLKDNDKTVLI